MTRAPAPPARAPLARAPLARAPLARSLRAALAGTTALALAAAPAAAADRGAPGARGADRAGDATGSLLYSQVPTPRIDANGADAVLARKFELGIGKSVIVELPRDAKEVFVANPAIANAVVRSTRKLFLIGVAAGTTTMYAMDAEGRQIAAFEINIGRDPNLLRQTLKIAMPKADITATAVGDTIVLSGTVDTVLEAQQAVDIARGFVGTSFVGASGGGGSGVSISSGGAVIEGKVINSITVRGRDQVMLKVTVAEVQRTVVKQLGVNINGSWDLAGSALTASVSPTLSAVRNLEGYSHIGSTNERKTKAIDVKALERNGLIRTLAEPTVTAISGETAKFFAGGEIPVPNSSNATDTGRITIGLAFKPYGVTLNFLPVVLSEGRISLSVGTEVTDIDGTDGFTMNGVNIPAFRTRKSSTTVELPSGGSLVTAGLIQRTSKASMDGTPGLMNLPILGALFRSRDYQRQDTELMIVVTPYIAKSNTATALARPTDGFVDAGEPQALLLGRLNKIYGVAGAPAGDYRGRYGFIHD